MEYGGWPPDTRCFGYTDFWMEFQATISLISWFNATVLGDIELFRLAESTNSNIMAKAYNVNRITLSEYYRQVQGSQDHE